MSNYKMITERGAVPVKAWVEGVDFEDEARKQLINTAKLPFVFKWVAAMPDTHWGLGATVGSVVATKGAIVPAAVGVDIGCGMAAYRTTLKAEDLPDNLAGIRAAIERAVPTAAPSAAAAVTAAHGTTRRTTIWRPLRRLRRSMSASLPSTPSWPATPTRPTTWAPWARVTTSLKCAWTPRARCG